MEMRHRESAKKECEMQDAARPLIPECQEMENRVGESGEVFVTEVWIDDGGFLWAQVVEDGVLGQTKQ